MYPIDIFLNNINSYFELEKFKNQTPRVPIPRPISTNANKGVCFGLTHMWIQAILCGNSDQEERFYNRLELLFSDFNKIKCYLSDELNSQISKSNYYPEYFSETYYYSDPGSTHPIYPHHSKPLGTNATTRTSIGVFKNSLQKAKNLNDIIDAARQYVRSNQSTRVECLFPVIQMILEIPAFIEGVMLYLAPKMFPVSETKVQNAPILSRRTMNHTLDRKYKDSIPENCLRNPLTQLNIAYSKSVMGDIKSLSEIFRSILEHLSSFWTYSEPYAIELNSYNHSIGVALDSDSITTRGFKLFDQNAIELTIYKFQSHILLTNINSLVWHIINAFTLKGMNNNTIQTFSLTVYLPPNYNYKKDRLKAGFDKITKLRECYDRMIDNYYDSTTSKNVSLLNIAFQRGDLSTINSLLEKSPKGIVNQVSDGWTPLNIACKDESLDIATLLLDGGADVNKANSDGWTPLNIACKYGYLNIATLLLDRRANVNQTSPDTLTPLHIACDNNQLDIVRLLVSRGANLKETYKNLTPLKIAENAKSHQVVQFLNNHISHCVEAKQPWYKKLSCTNIPLDAVSDLSK